MPRLLNKFWILYKYPFFLFLLTLTIYIHNLAQGIYAGDVGDFPIAASTKGVGHPSGYPLFTMLGILFLNLPIPFTPAAKVGLISAMSASFAVVLFYSISLKLIRQKVFSTIASLILAFVYPFWLYAEVAEVFAFNNFFILLIVYLAILYFQKKSTKLFYIISFTFGLSLSHHQFSLLVVGVTTIFMLIVNWKILTKPILLIKAFGLFILGLTPYLYIPIATHLGSSYLWYPTMDLGKFIHYVLRLDYGGVSFNDSANLLLRYLSLKTYSLYLFKEISPLIFAVSMLGAFYSFRRFRFIFFYFLLCFIITGPFFISYISTPVTGIFTYSVLERFYFISGIFALLYFPFGMVQLSNMYKYLLEKVKIPFSRYSFALTIFFILMPLLLFLKNIQKTDLHDTWVGNELGENVFKILPKNSYVFLLGDTLYYNTAYLHFSEGKRKDLHIVNMGRIDEDPHIYSLMKNINFPKDRRKKEDKILYTLEWIAKKNPVYANAMLQYFYKSEQSPSWIPYGFLYKLMPSGYKDPPEEFLKRQERIFKELKYPDGDTVVMRSSTSLRYIYEIYMYGFVNTGQSLINTYQDLENAKTYYEKAISLSPDFSVAYEGLGTYYLAVNRCSEAEKNLLKSIEMNPQAKNSYIFLYITYESCFKDQDKAYKVAYDFGVLFKKKISDEILDWQKKIESNSNK